MITLVLPLRKYDFSSKRNFLHSRTDNNWTGQLRFPVILIIVHDWHDLEYVDYTYYISLVLSIKFEYKILMEFFFPFFFLFSEETGYWNSYTERFR
jgi:hypothetical protein